MHQQLPVFTLDSYTWQICQRSSASCHWFGMPRLQLRFSWIPELRSTRETTFSIPNLHSFLTVCLSLHCLHPFEVSHGLVKRRMAVLSKAWDFFVCFLSKTGIQLGNLGNLTIEWFSAYLFSVWPCKGEMLCDGVAISYFCCIAFFLNDTTLFCFAEHFTKKPLLHQMPWLKKDFLEKFHNWKNM